MDYFSKFLKTGSQPAHKAPVDHAQEFHKSWMLVKNTLLQPDERQLTKGIQATDVPAHLRSMVDALVWESNRVEEGGTGACLEYLLKNVVDVLGTLVRLSEADRPAGIQAEVLRSVQNMVVMLDEQFLVHSAVHKAVLRLLRNCVGDDIQEQLDGRNKVMGAAGNIVRTQPSEYEEDLVNLLCILCSRIRTYRELLMIFFHDKHWYRSEPLFAEEEEDGDEDEDEDDVVANDTAQLNANSVRSASPTSSQATIKSKHQLPASKRSEYEFLLFNYLLRFVHREGQIGEFARAGLLFLVDVAMSPSEPSRKDVASSDPGAIDPINDAALALSEYILDGDFSEVLGAGLSAVYSLLPSKLGFFPQSSPDTISNNGMVIGGTGAETEEERQKLDMEREEGRAMGVEDAQSPDFKARLDHFLKLLEFLQDVLRRNSNQENLDPSTLVGTAIVQSILDAVRCVFLENVLYPSILECSDSDGSAVAVMSYIEIMIRTLQEGPLADLLINFLITEDNEEPKFQRTQNTMSLSQPGASYGPSAMERRAKHRRRKSSAMALLELEAPDSRKPTEYFTMSRFTLKDLLLANLRSNYQPTAIAALQLLQSMILHYPRLCTDRLFLTTLDPTATVFPYPSLSNTSTVRLLSEDDEDSEEIFQYSSSNDDAPLYLHSNTTYSTHEREMSLYLALISRMDATNDGEVFSTGYDHYLNDAIASIQNQRLYQEAFENPDVKSLEELKHKLNLNDPFLSPILEALRRFFSNTPELNIALTGVLAMLAIHPHRSISGWVTFASDEPSISTESGDFNKQGEDGDDRSIDFEIEERLTRNVHFLPAASLNDNSRPVLYTIFHGLVSQLERYRRVIENFDKFLLERRQGLLFSENLMDALNIIFDLKDEQVVAPSAEISQAPKQKSKTKTSSLVSFLTPKKNKPSKPPPTAEPSTPERKNGRSVAASPFEPHYQHTRAITVEPFVAPIPSTGLWTPAKSVRWDRDEDDVFGSSGWGTKADELSVDHGDDNEDKDDTDKVTITLSRLLDNVVILEESIKELVAIIHARRSLGIDPLRYL
ncbi:Retinoic acid induced 16-like protein-domain-containing protein [Cyathus striatus]|nr:Retinoic acid induced 16-like protein-domain-containing protein [Cyathus striatus]